MSTRPHILQLEPMLPLVHEQLESHFTVLRLWLAPDRSEFLAEHAASVRAIVVGGHSSVGDELIKRFPQLEIIASFGVGYDHIDALAAAQAGVVVTNTPDVLSDEVADLAIGLLITTVRRTHEAERFLRDGQWVNGPFPLTASLRGRRVGILGLGRIGKAIARRLSGFDLDVAYCGRQRQEGLSLPYYESLIEMARDVDVLISAAPGGEATKGIIDAQVLQALGSAGILVNVGRGSVVDEAALSVALAQGTIAAAGLDVFEHEPNPSAAIMAAPNTVLLPHVGSGSVVTRNAMGQLVVDNLLQWFGSNRPLTPVKESEGLLAGRTVP